MKLNNIKRKMKNILQLRLFRSTNLLTYVEAKDMLKEDVNGILIDVRSIQEYKEYHLNGAICIPLYELQVKIENIVQNKQQLIILYCQSGARSKRAVEILEAMGYTNLYEIDGGIDNI